VKFTRRLTIFSIAAGIVWFVACVGTGFFLRPFIVLCGWPVTLSHKLLPVTFPSDVFDIAWPKLCVISLVSWMVLALLAATASHCALLLCEQSHLER
jgi:hypothetical protein